MYMYWCIEVHDMYMYSTRMYTAASGKWFQLCAAKHNYFKRMYTTDQKTHQLFELETLDRTPIIKDINYFYLPLYIHTRKKKGRSLTHSLSLSLLTGQL